MNKLRTTIVLGVLGAITAGAIEVRVSDERRTDLSAVVLTGTVTNIEHLPLVKTNITSIVPRNQDLGWLAGSVAVKSVPKQDRKIGTVTAVYFPQQPIALDQWGAGFGGRICPDYPQVVSNMTATVVPTVHLRRAYQCIVRHNAIVDQKPVTARRLNSLVVSILRQLKADSPPAPPVPSARLFAVPCAASACSRNLLTI